MGKAKAADAYQSSQSFLGSSISFERNAEWKFHIFAFCSLPHTTIRERRICETNWIFLLLYFFFTSAPASCFLVRQFHNFLISDVNRRTSWGAHEMIFSFFSLPLLQKWRGHSDIVRERKFIKMEGKLFVNYFKLRLFSLLLCVLFWQHWEGWRKSQCQWMEHYHLIHYATHQKKRKGKEMKIIEMWVKKLLLESFQELL